MAAPGGGPYWALGKGWRGGAPAHTVVGVAKGVAPEAVTTTAPGAGTAEAIPEDCKENKDHQYIVKKGEAGRYLSRNWRAKKVLFKIP